MYAYIHPECGKPAFLLTKRPEPGTVFSSKTAAHLNGSPMEYGSKVWCESCDKPVFQIGGIPSTENVRTMI